MAKDSKNFGSIYADTISFDDILEKVGSFHTFQRIYFLFMIYIGLFACMEPLWLNFTAYDTPHFCRADQLRHFPQEIQKYIAIPINEDGEYDECKIFDINFTHYSIEELAHWNRTNMKDRFSVQNCNEWVYNTTFVGPTIVDQFNWVCDKKTMGNLAATVSMLGFLVTGLFSGSLTDAYGRKNAWIFCLIFKLLGHLIMNCFINQYTFMTGQFISSAAGIGLYSSTYMINIELVGSKYRSIITMSMGLAYSVGVMVIPLIALTSHNWIIFQWINFGLTLLMFSFLFIMKESPRWLLMKGRYLEYVQIMKYIAKINNRDVGQTIESVKMETQSEKQNPSVLKIFTVSKTRTYTLALFTMWFSCSLLFYAISFNVGTLVGNIYVNGLLVGLVEIPGNLSCMVMLNSPKFGRRYTHMIFFIVAGVSNLAILPFLFTSPESYFITILTLVAKSSITGAFNALFVYTSELYPTQFRFTGLMMCNAVCRIGGIIAPYFGETIQELWTPLPTLVFGLTCTLTGFLFLILPETLNKDLPETMEDFQQYEFIKKNESQADLSVHF